MAGLTPRNWSQRASQTWLCSGHSTTKWITDSTTPGQPGQQACTSCLSREPQARRPSSCRSSATLARSLNRNCTRRRQAPTQICLGHARARATLAASVLKLLDGGIETEFLLGANPTPHASVLPGRHQRACSRVKLSSGQQLHVSLRSAHRRWTQNFVRAAWFAQDPCGVPYMIARRLRRARGPGMRRLQPPHLRRLVCHSCAL